MRRAAWLLLGLALVCTSATARATPRPPPQPSHGGPIAAFRCGLRTLSYGDPSTSKATPMAVYYPTSSPEKRTRKDPHVLLVAGDAPMAAGVFPLVMLSHGSGGTTFGHYDTACYLARHGYVVGAPLHAGNNFFDHSAEGTARMWRGRPKALSAALDAVLADAALAPHIDRARIGAAGFSAGGYTVLVAAGAVGDMAGIARHCTAHATDDLEFCDLAGKSLPPKPFGDDTIVHAADPRIRAVVAMAPVAVLFGPGSMADVTVPVRLYQAERDRVLRSPFHVENVRKLLPKPPEYVLVENAAHYAFLSPFPAAARASLGEIAADPAGFDRAGFHEQLNGEILAFFARTLRP
jgi:predicted dienelactone hydrolase